MIKMHIDARNSNCGLRGSYPRLVGRTLLASCLWAGQFAHAQILLKSCDTSPAPCELTLSAQTTVDFLTTLATGQNDALYGFVSFSRHPSAGERLALRQVGIQVLAPVRERTYRVKVEKKVDLNALAARALDTQLRLVAIRERADPTVWGAVSHELKLMVRFHDGVSDKDMAAALSSAIEKEQLSDELWSVRMKREGFAALASNDAIRWIDVGRVLQKLGVADVPHSVRGGDKDLIAIGVDQLQNFDVHSGKARGLSGERVRVGVFDAGVDERHRDFAPRRVIREDAARSWHGTHIAGIIAGNGAMTQEKDDCGLSPRADSAATGPFQWRGVAPSASILDIEKGGEEALRGVDASVYWRYIASPTFGMDLSNHSYPFSHPGVYDNNNHERDRLIRGDSFWSGNSISPRLQVTSAGNGQQFFSITKELKNALVVGNWHTEDGAVHPESSRGPAHDGRIKPDVVAPGTHVRAPGFCLETDIAFCAVTIAGSCPLGPFDLPMRQNFYHEARGSSQASAMASGVVALMLDQHARVARENTPKEIERPVPQPATLRGVLIHTAGDPLPVNGVNPHARRYRAPELVSGWGLIDAAAAAAKIRDGLTSEHELVGTCSEHVHAFYVTPGTDRLRVTLAWDDPASDPALAREQPKLVNDLDLMLVDPSGKKHYPWVLDQKSLGVDGSELPLASQQCGESQSIHRSFLSGVDSVPTARPGKDRLNNIEVVDVEGAPVPGVWKAYITGFSVPHGPQRYSLIGVEAANSR